MSWKYYLCPGSMLVSSLRGNMTHSHCKMICEGVSRVLANHGTVLWLQEKDRLLETTDESCQEGLRELTS